MVISLTIFSIVFLIGIIIGAVFLSKNKKNIFWVLIVLIVFLIFLLNFKIFNNKNVADKNNYLLGENNKKIITLKNKNSNLYKVIKVIDGDTIEVNISGQKKVVRLIGIDTPEIVDPQKPIECFAFEASNKAKEILNNKEVFLKIDSTQKNKDKYGRLLRYIFLIDKTNFNKLMINEGYAREYTYKNIPYKYQKEFKQAENEARENKRGLWAKCF